MLALLATYLLLASSFSISSYFFIHLPALKYAGIKNDMIYSISYLITAFIYFPKSAYCWFTDMQLFKETLYSGNISE